jgi:PEP-CTERM motif
LNDAGELVFQANVLTSGAAPTKRAIYLWSEGAIEPIVRVGDSIPNGTGTFSQIEMIRPALNSLGETVFWAEFTDNNVKFNGLFVGSADGLVEVARSGQPAPDQIGVIGPYLSGLTEINDAGQFAFTAASDWRSTDGAAYIYDGNDLTTIARIGQPLAGSTLESIESLCSCDSMNINAEGQVVFQFQLTDDRTGILLFTPDGPPTPGDFNKDGTVDAADYVVWRKNPGGIYTPDDYNTWCANFGKSSSLGSGSGANAIEGVPEPATIMLLLFAAAGLRSRRRRIRRPCH